MLSLIELLALMFVLSMGLAVTFKNRIEKMLPISVMVIVLIMYISGYMRNLKIGFYGVLVITVIAAVYTIYYIIKNKREVLKYLSPYALYYILFAAWLYIRFSGRMINEWDEFTHWGFTTKVMFDSNMFSNELGSTIYFVDYLPGTALFQYFAMQFEGVLREDLMSIAQGLFIFSFIMPILGELKVGIKQAVSSALILFTAFIIPMGFYPNVYYSLYVDAALGVVFAYIMYQCLKEEKYDIFYYVKVSLACGTLCIIKPSGIGLMAIAAIIVLADNVAKGRYKEFIKSKNYIKLIFDVIPFVIGFIYKKMWAIRLDKLGYNAHFDTKRITISGVIDIFTGGGEEYQQTTVTNFIRSFVGSNYVTYNFSSLICYIFLFVAAILILYTLQRGSKKRFIVLGITTSGAYLLYSFYMLLLYLFTYSPSEAVNLASFRRYEYTVILGICFGLLLWLLHILSTQEEQRYNFYFIVMMSLFFILPEGTVVQVMNKGEIDYSINFRQNYSFADRVRESLSDKDKVYIISQGTDGFDYFILRYTLSPVHTQTRADDQGWWEVSWNIGQDNGTGSSRREITDEEWMDYLIAEGYNYVLLYKIDDQFIEEFGQLFNQVPEGNQLYKINYENETLEYYEVE